VRTTSRSGPAPRGAQVKQLGRTSILVLVTAARIAFDMCALVARLKLIQHEHAIEIHRAAIALSASTANLVKWLSGRR